MAQVDVNPSSYLNFSQLLELNGVAFWDETELPDIPFSDQDQFIQLTRIQAKRLDLLANQVYGDPQLWWVILQANNIDLPSDLYEGLLVRVPDKTTIDALFQNSSTLT